MIQSKPKFLTLFRDSQAKRSRTKVVTDHQAAISDYYTAQSDYEHAKLVVRLLIDRVGAAQKHLESTGVAVKEMLGEDAG